MKNRIHSNERLIDLNLVRIKPDNLLGYINPIETLFISLEEFTKLQRKEKLEKLRENEQI